jgi:hypothetical protein
MHSETWTFVDGRWLDGNPGLTGPRSHAFWLASSVFDGARYFEGVMPDMTRHGERLNRSAVALGLKPTGRVPSCPIPTRRASASASMSPRCRPRMRACA